MNIIYNVCKDCGNQVSFTTYKNGMVQCNVCNSMNIEHNVEAKLKENK